VLAFSEAQKAFIARGRYDENAFPTVIPNWDNTPRLQQRGLVLTGSTPGLFRQQMVTALGCVADHSSDRRLIFVKSWNEWAEGNHLEPDIEYGRGYLEALRSSLTSGTL
jgi:hypothetical protein